MKIAIIFLIIGILIGVFGGTMIILYFINLRDKVIDEGFDEFEISQDCYKKNLEDTSECLVDYVRGFYNYTSTGDFELKSFDDLKETGGDCFDYSILYRDMFKELGFDSKVVLLSGDKESHQVTLTWDGKLTEYCLVDQTSYKCFELKGDEKDG